MITANYQPTSSGLQIRFNIPDPEKGYLYEYTTAADLQEAKRKLYFRLRRYITSKLLAWLRQRYHAIAPNHQSDRYAEKIAALQTLMLQLQHFEKVSYWQLCTLVCRQVGKFRLLAPSENSRYYRYYIRVILPIIDHCKEMSTQS